MQLQNIYVDFYGHKVYMTERLDNGELKLREDEDFYPYYYEKCDSSEANKLTYIGSEPVKQVFLHDVQSLKKIPKNSRTFEVDVDAEYQYMLDKIDKLLPSKTRWILFDIETLVRNPMNEVPNKETAHIDMISAVTMYDNYTGEIFNMFMGDILGIYGDVSHIPEKELKKAEKQIIIGMIKFVLNHQPDVMGAWKDSFDHEFIYHRCLQYDINFAEIISPFGKTRWSHAYEKPVGVSYIDYMELYRKFTVNKLPAYNLEYVLDHVRGYGKKHPKVNFRQLNPDLNLRNIDDVKDIVEFIEKPFKLMQFYDNMRIKSKLLWESIPGCTINFKSYSRNSTMINNLLLIEARKQNLVLDNKGKSSTENNETLKEKLENEADIDKRRKILAKIKYGAYRECYKIGRFKDVKKVDLSGAYPQQIVDFCLSPANLKGKPNDNTVGIPIYSRNDDKTTEYIDTYFYEQNENDILVQMVKNSLNEKALYKDALKKLNPNTKEYEDKEQLYDMIKTIINCFSKDTQVITTQGIKYIKDIKIGDKVINVNPKTLEVEEDIVVDTQAYLYSGDMFHYKNIMTDLLVTPEHKFLVQKRIGKAILEPEFDTISNLYKEKMLKSLIPAVHAQNDLSQNNEYIDLIKELRELGGEIWCKPKDRKETYKIRNKSIFNLKLSKNKRYEAYNWRTCNINDITDEELYQLHNSNWIIMASVMPHTKLTPIIYNKKDFSEFLGWHISEGNLLQSKKTNYKGIQISQHGVNETFRQEIEELLKQLKLSYKKSSTGFIISSLLLYHYLSKHCNVGSYNIQIPEFFMHEKTIYKQYLFNTLYKGDGNKRNSRYNTASYKLFQQLMCLIPQLGYNSLRYTHDKDDCYRIYFNNEQKGIYHYNIDKESYNDYIYCITTQKNHNCYAGLNNRFTLTGQSQYGVLAMSGCRMSEVKITNTITFLVRDLFAYCLDKCSPENLNRNVVDITKNDSNIYEFNPIFCDTDSFAVNTNIPNVHEFLNELIKKWSIEKYGKESQVRFDFEGTCLYLLNLSNCRYRAISENKKGRKIQDKGIQVKRMDSSEYQKTYMDKLLNYILVSKDITSKELKKELDTLDTNIPEISEQEVVEYILKKREDFKNLPVIDISKPKKIKKLEYNTTQIFERALIETNKYIEFKPEMNEIFYIIYIKPKDYQYKQVNEYFFKDGKKLTPKPLKLKAEELGIIQGILTKKDFEENVINKLLELGEIEVRTKQVIDKPMDVIAFNEDNLSVLDNVEIDYDRMLSLNTYAINKKVFEAMNWDFNKLNLNTEIDENEKELKLVDESAEMED